MASTRDTNPNKNNPSRLGSIIFKFGKGFFALGLILLALVYYPVAKVEVKYSLSSGLDLKASPLTPPNKDFSIVIPDIQAVSIIVPDVDPYNSYEYQQALTKGVAHAKDSGLPGEGSNIFLFSHSSVDFYIASRYNSIFYLLHKLVPGEEIKIYYKGEEFLYKVKDVKKVTSDSVEYLSDRGLGESLTLMTCWPPGTTLERLIVTALPSK